MMESWKLKYVDPDPDLDLWIYIQRGGSDLDLIEKSWILTSLTTVKALNIILSCIL